MKRYELLKDTITYSGLIMAGSIFTQKSNSDYGNGSHSVFGDTTVENNPEWFREIKWKPEIGEKYQYIDISFSCENNFIGISSWEDHKIDTTRYVTGNCFHLDSKDVESKAAQIRKILKGE